MFLKKTIWIYLFVVILNVYFGSCLECYVCSEQDENTEKCLKTIKTCQYGEDMCLTEIKWGTQPYWSQGAKKQYFISKRCATKKICEKTRSKYMPYCTHLWYQDWKCSECCAGDRCNYYVITGSSMAKANSLVITTGIILFFFVRRYF
uniref:UPAR/Ly6 domain-containing protein n=1 Tax=Clastoptera arizonana TaxID=38151 RepID=A0A1B6EG04_9HEMI